MLKELESHTEVTLVPEAIYKERKKFKSPPVESVGGLTSMLGPGAEV